MTLACSIKKHKPPLEHSLSLFSADQEGRGNININGI